MYDDALMEVTRTLVPTASTKRLLGRSAHRLDSRSSISARHSYSPKDRAGPPNPHGARTPHFRTVDEPVRCRARSRRLGYRPERERE